jgi:hypothetical protein
MGIEKPKVVESKITVYEVEIDALELHECASLTPTMTELEFTALKLDIEINGQKEPGTLYRNKVIDGRHRMRALAELGITTMLFTKLPSTTTLAEIGNIVRSKETRRHDSIAQKAIMAYRYLINSTDKVTQVEAGLLYGVDRKRIMEVKKIAEVFGRLDIIEGLFKGEKFNIGEAPRTMLTDSLGSIINWLGVHTPMTKESTVMDMLKHKDDELSFDEELLVSKLASQIGKEREAVRKALASRLYAIGDGEIK